MAAKADDRTASATFPPEPLSVRGARGFVSDRLTVIRRADLVEVAELAVSELATNVVLHARTDFGVEVTPLGDDRVRVSVTDGSPSVPVVQPATAGAALGRGLRLVEELSDAWGVERIDNEDPTGPGKVVWFEVGAAQSSGGVLADRDYEPTVTELLTVPPVPTEALVDVQLLNTPLQLFARETVRHRELMREMALIAFSDEPATHHVPQKLTDLASELESYRGVGAATDALRDAAIARGDAAIDLVYRLPPAVGPACVRLNELLDEAEQYCRSENLLTLAATPAGLELRRWYLNEIGNQINGLAPTPWTGPLI